MNRTSPHRHDTRRQQDTAPSALTEPTATEIAAMALATMAPHRETSYPSENSQAQTAPSRALLDSLFADSFPSASTSAIQSERLTGPSGSTSQSTQMEQPTVENALLQQRLALLEQQMSNIKRTCAGLIQSALVKGTQAGRRIAGGGQVVRTQHAEKGGEDSADDEDVERSLIAVDDPRSSSGADEDVESDSGSNESGDEDEDGEEDGEEQEDDDDNDESEGHQDEEESDDLESGSEDEGDGAEERAQIVSATIGKLQESFIEFLEAEKPAGAESGDQQQVFDQFKDYLAMKFALTKAKPGPKPGSRQKKRKNLGETGRPERRRKIEEPQAEYAYMEDESGLYAFKLQSEIPRAWRETYKHIKAPVPIAPTSFRPDANFKYEMSTSVVTVFQLWREWHWGLSPSQPSVIFMDSILKSKWRMHTRERKYFSLRKVIIDECRAIMQRNSWGVLQTLNYVEEKRCDHSLSTLGETLQWRRRQGIKDGALVDMDNVVDNWVQVKMALRRKANGRRRIRARDESSDDQE